jgi:hypothetical protein
MKTAQSVGKGNPVDDALWRLWVRRFWDASATEPLPAKVHSLRLTNESFAWPLGAAASVEVMRGFDGVFHCDHNPRSIYDHALRGSHQPALQRTGLPGSPAISAMKKGR